MDIPQRQRQGYLTKMDSVMEVLQGRKSRPTAFKVSIFDIRANVQTCSKEPPKDRI